MMPRCNCRPSILVFLGLIMSLIAPQLASAVTLIGKLQEPALDYHHLPVSAELALARKLFAQMTASGWQPSAAQRHQAAALGFGWEDWQGLVILREPADQRRGNGAYVFNPEGNAKLMLQAPHRFSDRKSGVIAMHLFTLSNARVLALNNAHRYSDAADGRKSDLAHRHDSIMMELTLAFAAQQPQGMVYQLHGFAREKLPAQDRDARVIVSAGHSWPGTPVIAIKACLAQFQSGVKLYPMDIGKLGATTNTMGRALRARGHHGFVHVELSAELRKELVKNPGLRQNYADCLAYVGGDKT